MITPDVDGAAPPVRLPGMRIPQFAFGGGSGNAFLPHNHERRQVVYTGTHDNDTTPGWWAAATSRSAPRVRDYLARRPTRSHWDLIRAACASVADTVVHPMQDVLGLGGFDTA